MPELKIGKTVYSLNENETVLDCLLRNEKPVPYSCKSGVCQACLVKSVDSTPPAKACAGLKPTLQAGGYVMSCQWVPETDVEVRLPGTEELAISVRIKSMDMLNSGVMRLLLVPEDTNSMFSSCPGQYLSLISPSDITRSYSIANDFLHDGYLELHVAQTSRGLFTNWLFNEAKVGQTLYARGPAGACFYLDAEQGDFPMLLVGTGTGLAPLYGIVRDALHKNHTGPITLLHGGTAPERLYYVNELKALAQKHPNFRYQGIVLAGPVSDTAHIEGDVIAAALATLDASTLPRLRVFLCGAPDFVHNLRKKIFLKGARSAHIFCDAFVTRTIAAMG
ncbi:MAG: FAD-binding oxidoreductase [Pseudomonadota bacterium]